MTEREGRTLKEQTATERPARSPYDFIKGIDLENRELLDKPEGTGLFDLVKKGDGSYRCYACGLCEKTCPEDCIQVDYSPEHPEKPFDVSRERAAALAAAAGGVPQPELDMSKFDAVVVGIRAGAGLVEALHATQETYGYLPRAILENIADEMQLPLSRIYGVASFYGQFRLTPVGRHVIDVCVGTACHVAGAPLVVEAFSQDLGIAVGETTCDGLFTLQTVNCVGACALAPVVRVGADTTLGRVGPNEARRLVRKLRKLEVG